MAASFLTLASKGVFMVFMYVGSQQAAGALSDASSRTRVFTILTVSQSLALLVSPPITGLLIDHFGLLGMPEEPITLARLIGVFLLCAGALLLRY